MKVILKEKMKNLGGIGDLVDVAGGYGRYLISVGKSLPATKQNIAQVQETFAKLKAIDDEKKNVAQERADDLALLDKVEIVATANAEGRLFGALTVADVTKAISARGKTVQKSEISILDGPIRQVGVYHIQIQCHPEVSIELPLHVLSDQVGEDEDDAEKTVEVYAEKSEATETVES